MLLQDSLGGDAKALMFCNVAPIALHAGDTFSSLTFASKVHYNLSSATCNHIVDFQNSVFDPCVLYFSNP